MNYRDVERTGWQVSEVSFAIPGARRPVQASDNVVASDLGPLS